MYTRGMEGGVGFSEVASVAKATEYSGEGSAERIRGSGFSKGSPAIPEIDFHRTVPPGGVLISKASHLVGRILSQREVMDPVKWASFAIGRESAS